MKTTPKISVVIPCFNAAAWIRETIGSVLDQQRDDLEIILIDDGSTDESAAIVEREFPSVSLTKTGNRGASAARNLGTALARGDFIQYLDSDDLLAPGKLDMQLRALEASGADVAYGDWQRLVRAADGTFEAGAVTCRTLGECAELDLFDQFWCPPAAYLFRRRIVESVGNWNERLPVIQDARFALDCALRGGVFQYCAGVMAYYRQHGQTSLSRRNAIAFVRDIYANTLEVEQWWRTHGGLEDRRRDLIVKGLAYVARATYAKDAPTFEAALADLERVCPGYVPPGPASFRLASSILGYRRAEALAHATRGPRSVLRRLRTGGDANTAQ